MMNVQKIYSDIKTLEFIPAKSKWGYKIWNIVMFVLFLSLGLCVRCWLRPYIYDNGLREYYLVFGAMPSFISIPIIYYGSISYYLFKSKKLNTDSCVPFLTISTILSIYYEFFLSTIFDVLDILAIILGSVTVVAIEETRSQFCQIVKK